MIMVLFGVKGIRNVRTKLVQHVYLVEIKKHLKMNQIRGNLKQNRILKFVLKMQEYIMPSVWIKLNYKIEDINQSFI